MNNNLLILGAGCHGKVVKETAEAMNCFDKIEFLDDHFSNAIGRCGDYLKCKDEYKCAFVSFGDNELRMKWLNELSEFGYEVPKLIHPTAYVSPSAVVNEGTIILPKSVINTNAVVEKGCIISIVALVDHDSQLGDGVHINTGAIVKAGCKVNSLKMINAGEVYTNEYELNEYSFEVGV